MTQNIAGSAPIARIFSTSDHGAEAFTQSDLFVHFSWVFRPFAISREYRNRGRKGTVERGPENLASCNLERVTKRNSIFEYFV